MPMFGVKFYVSVRIAGGKRDDEDMWSDKKW